MKSLELVDQESGDMSMTELPHGLDAALAFFGVRGPSVVGAGHSLTMKVLVEVEMLLAENVSTTGVVAVWLAHTAVG